MQTDTMARSLPSLDLLRGFEAAARQLSFTRAAAELFLTQSAVSRQVQALEEHLGVPLFERRHREIRLTDAGQQLYRTAAEALRQLSDTADRIRAQNQARALTVSCSIGFSSSTGSRPTSTIAKDGSAASARRSSRARL
jgi:LysR family glycine cleavage system transcriptional activator